MPHKRSRKTETKDEEAGFSAFRSMPAAEALSFLRDTRGLTTWTTRDLGDALKISADCAKQVISILELQGYVKPATAGEWMTTLSGEEVSGSKPPRFTRERVEQALAELRRRVAETNRDTRAQYKIIQAVAFGDFLNDRPRVQSAEVGIQLEPGKPAAAGADSAKEHKARRAFLKQLKGKGGACAVRPCEKWMSERTHLELLA